MHSTAPSPVNRPVVSIVGLAIALLGAPVFMVIYRCLTGENRSDGQVLIREIGIFCLVGLLLWLVKTQEKLPLSSIGLNTDRVGRSLLRGVLLTLLVLAVTVGLYVGLGKLGIHLGDSGPNHFQPSLWLVTLIVLRAGIAEEIFYRGYAIERLNSLTAKPWLAALLPLILFAAAHYRQGLGGVIAAFVLGGIFTLVYLRFRDLLANMTAHFLTDFVLNVILPLMSAG